MSKTTPKPAPRRGRAIEIDARVWACDKDSGTLTVGQLRQLIPNYAGQRGAVIKFTHRCRKCDKRYTHEKTTNCNGMIYCNGMTCCAPLVTRGGASWQPLKITRAEIVAPGEVLGGPLCRDDDYEIATQIMRNHRATNHAN